MIAIRTPASGAGRRADAIAVPRQGASVAPRFAAGWNALAILFLAALVAAGCTSTPEKPSEGVEKSVIGVAGVAHTPVLVAPDRVAAGKLLGGWAKADEGAVLVQAILEEGRRPIGQAKGSPMGGRAEFVFSVPPDATGRILVRALDDKGLFTDKIVEVVSATGR